MSTIQLLGVYALVVLLSTAVAIIVYVKGYNEGKRYGYHMGRSARFRDITNANK